jgi:hypothetical protein
MRTEGVKAEQMWKVYDHILEFQRVKIGTHSVDSAASNARTGKRKHMYLRRICEDEINRNKIIVVDVLRCVL